MNSGILHYLNADFDVSLRKNPRKLTAPALQKTVKAMTLHGLLQGGPGDAVLVRAGIEGDLPAYFHSCGIAMPRVLRLPDTDRAGLLSPFGWNAEAAALNEGQRFRAGHPRLEVVRKVNSRIFSAALEEELSKGREKAASFGDLETLARWIAEGVSPEGGWVVKADHGNAGLGNRRIAGPDLSAADSRFITGALKEDDAVVIEPWRERLGDLTTVFHLGGEGSIGGVRVHEAVYTRGGALIGVLFTGETSPWYDRLAEAAGKIAAALVREGYFGPVCFDSFTYDGGGEARLRLLADLNCRRPMSDAIYGFWNSRHADRALYWRLFNTAKLHPDAVPSVRRAAEGYSPRTRRGMLLTSPWRIEVDGSTGRAPKLGVAFIGRTKDEALVMEKEFRRRFER